MQDYFIYIGRLDELKGIKILFEAWKRMGASAPLLIVCGKGTLDDWCKSFLKEHDDLNIDMKGFVSNDEAKNLTAGAKALILPTQCYEGFPMTIVESFSVGTPVIGSDVGNVGDLIENGANGWKFRVGSVESLVACVEGFQNSKGLDSVKIMSLFKERYSESRNIEMLECIYNQVSDKKMIGGGYSLDVIFISAYDAVLKGVAA